jgi:HK97 family phage major capsid protein
MPNSAQLVARAKEIETAVKTISENPELTGAQRQEQLENLRKDWEAHQLDVKNSEAAASFRKELSAGASEKSADEVSPESYRIEVPNLKQASRALGMAILKSPGYQRALAELGGRDGMGMKNKFDHAFDVSLKDSTAAANLMGEGLFGTSGPTAAGQNPFLPGAYGPGILPMFLPGVVEQRFYELTIADLFTSIPTSSPDVTYLVESTANFNAAATAEAGTFPFSSEEFSRVYEQIGKITNAAQVTDEIVRDAPFLFNFLQGRLIEGIQRQEEVQLLAGGGYPGVNGLLTRSSGFTASSGTGATSGTGSSVVFPAASTPGAGAQSATITTLHYGRVVAGTGTTGTPATAVAIAEGAFGAIIDIQTSLFYNPNAILMNPADYHTIRIGKDANGQYYGGSMWGADYGYTQNTGTGYIGNPGNTLWGCRVVQTPAMPAGNILVGYFGPEVANTLRREGISMQMSNQAGSNFVDGEVTLRAEERLGLAVYRPKAFELIQVIPAP